MPWSTPTLREVRTIVRDNIRGSLPGADASVPNSVLRVLSDSQGALCHLTLQYIDWLALQLLPDTAETEWLDRHGEIWLVNADGTIGRKNATFASGTATFTGTAGAVVPVGTQLSGADVGFETTAQITIGGGPTEGPVRALDAGSAGNLGLGAGMTLTEAVPGVDSQAIVVLLDGGFDTESDEDLRARILFRIQNPPMGGSQADYVRWALAVPGVTRAWAAPEQGPGTITVRFLMDDVRAEDDGWPTPADIQMVHDYIDTVRPVTVMGCYVVAPIKEFIDVTILNLVPNNESTKAAIVESLRDMLYEEAAPGQTIYGAWISRAILDTPGVVSFNLTTYEDHVMPSLGHMALLGTVLFDE
jgi:uncharacterized phage protein gp47/JayE